MNATTPGIPDFFVSYNKTDRQSAEWIAWQLESAGYSVVIQAWDFRPGSNFILEMNRAAQEAQTTIAVLSPDYIAALYTQPEWAAAFARDPLSRNRTLVGVLVRETELQGLLNQIIYINLVGLEEESARVELLSGLKPGRSKPEQAPAFPVIRRSHVSERLPNVENLDGRARSGSYESLFLPSRAILPRGFRASVDNFLATYLGSLDQPTPFGGRTEDLERLTDWLCSHHDSPYLCIASEAGRGKSALLVQWARGLVGKEDLFVIFIPISIRFETNTSGVVFGALASMLADYRDEPYPILGTIPPSTLKDLCREYIARGGIGDRRLLIILDGIDEAADSEISTNLFPLAPPPGLRVVVSARNKVETAEPLAWLHALGWDRFGIGTVFPLDPLTESGVADVIERCGIRVSGSIAQGALAKQIHRVSEGDPLLISFYVADLKNKSAEEEGMALAEMERLPAGLDAYFTSWLEDQRRLWGRDEDWKERSVHLVLSALACAFGPLMRDDILGVVPPEDKLDSWILHETLRPLGRLLVGDGRNQGVTFVHPRLATYFREKRLSQQEKSLWEKQFVAWGQQILAALREHQLKPTAVPTYLLRFYAEHLRQIPGNADTLYKLLCDEWMRASLTVDGTPSLFLGDAWRVWDVANQDGPRAIGMQLRAALCFSSVASSITKIKSDLLISCVHRNIISHDLAVVIARHKPDLKEKVECLCALAEISPIESRGPLLFEAMNAAHQIFEKKEKTLALVQVAARLPVTERDAVYEQARELMSELQCVAMYYVLKDTEHLWPEKMLPSLIDSLLEAARNDKNESSRAWIMEEMSKRFPSPKREIMLREALTAIMERPFSDHIRVVAKTGLAVQLPEPEKTAELDALLSLALAIDDDWSKVYALRDLARALPASRLQELINVARALDNESARAELLGDLAVLLTSDQQTVLFSEARQIAEEVEDDWWKAGILENLIPKVPHQFLRAIFDAAGAIGNQWAQAEVMTKLAPTLSGQEQDNALKLAFAVSQGIADFGDRAITLCKIIPVLSKKERKATVVETVRLARSSWDYEARASALGELARWVDSKDRDVLLRQAVDAASWIDNDMARAKALISLLPFLSPQLLNRVFALTKIPPKDENYYFQWQVLKALGQYLPDDLLTEVAEYIKAMVIDPEFFRAELLAEFIPRMKIESRLESLDQVRVSMEDRDAAVILLAVAVSLPRIEEQVDILAEALERASVDLYWIENRMIAARIYLQLALRSEGAQRDSNLSEALELFRSISYTPKQWELFGEIFPYLPDSEATKVLEEVLRASGSNEYIGNRVRDLGRFGRHLQGEDRERVLKETLDTIAAMNAEQNYDKAELLDEFAKDIPDELLERVLEMTWTLGHDYHVPRILSALAQRWDSMCRNDRALEFQRLTETLNIFKGCKREYMLGVIGALIPVIARIGGARAVSDTLSAIRDTATWWP